MLALFNSTNKSKKKYIHAEVSACTVQGQKVREMKKVELRKFSKGVFEGDSIQAFIEFVNINDLLLILYRNLYEIVSSLPFYSP